MYMLPGTENLPGLIPYKKTSSLFQKDKVIRKCMVHYLNKDVPRSLMQARLAQKGLKALECTSDGLCFFSSVAHQLYNDPSYHMNVHAPSETTVKNLLDPLQSNSAFVVTATYMV